MESVFLLSTQLRLAHDRLERVMDGVTASQAKWLPPGRAHPIGATYARALILEDAVVNALLKGDRPLFSTTWDNRVGVSDCMPLPGGLWPDFSGPTWEHYDEWARTVRVGLNGLRRYAQAVYASSDEYVASLKPDDLNRAVDLSTLEMGAVPLSSAVSAIMIGQVDSTRGEILCLLSLHEGV